jgi:hypothetical protein
MLKGRSALGLVILVLVFSLFAAGGAQGYHTLITSDPNGYTEIEWSILEAPQNPIEMIFTGGGFAYFSTSDGLYFAIRNASGDVQGSLFLGNYSAIAYDSAVAMDLVLGVWGKVEWWPGLIVGIDQESLDELNATAYAAAERVSGNYLNGTMTSYYDTLNVSGLDVDCFVFEYQQDPGTMEEPQHTYLAYSLETGILMRANTSYYYGGDIFKPYALTIEYSGYMFWRGYGVLEYVIIFGVMAGLVVAAVFIQKRIKKEKYVGRSKREESGTQEEP